jgi:hypothetical protein
MMFPVAVAGAWLVGNVEHVYVTRYFFNNLVLLTLPLIALRVATLLHVACQYFEDVLSAPSGITLAIVTILPVMLIAPAMEEGRAAPSHAATRISGAIEAMCRRAVPESTCRATMPRAFQPARADFVATLEAGPGPRILAALKQSPGGDGFFIPPGNDAYWRFVAGGNRPFESLNFLPPHFGLPVLLGLPPAAHGAEIQPIKDGVIGRYGEGQRSRALSDDELCRHARERNVTRITVFESLDSPNSRRLLDCRRLETAR